MKYVKYIKYLKRKIYKSAQQCKHTNCRLGKATNVSYFIFINLFLFCPLWVIVKK